MFGDAACTAELNTTEVSALKHAHKTFTEAKKATCTEKGNRAYWHCEDCGLYFADKDGVIDTEKSYDDNSSFIRNFKKIIGCTPYQWKTDEEYEKNKFLNYNITALKGWLE